MLEYALFLAKSAILKFLCNFIPFGKYRKKARNACFKYLDKYLKDKIITLDKVDSHLPREVLAQINAHNNEYFVAKNREIALSTINGGGGFIR